MPTPPFRRRWLSVAALGASLTLAAQVASTAATPPGKPAQGAGASKPAAAPAAAPVTVATCVAQPLPSSYQDIQAVYLAFYLRPGDPAGLRYWAEKAGGDITTILADFGNSAEAKRLYGDITPETIGDAIDKIYQALFGKAPDAAGKQHYIDGYRDGRYSAADLAYRILQGAQNDDKRAIEHKLAAANFFTRTVDADLDGKDQQVTYVQKDEETVRQWMQAITAASAPTPEQARQFVRDHVAAASDSLRQTQAKPQLASLTPDQAQAGQATRFTIRGQHLPSTARLNIGNAQCDAPAQVQCNGSGFTQNCTLGGDAGKRTITVQTAEGGQAIGTRDIQAEPNPQQPQPGQPAQPGITSFWPWRVAQGQATVFGVQGEGLPPTATLSIEGARCDNPTDVRADGGGFHQRCEITGEQGRRQIKVLDAKGGKEIAPKLRKDGTRLDMQLHVESSQSTPQKENTIAGVVNENVKPINESQLKAFTSVDAMPGMGMKIVASADQLQQYQIGDVISMPPAAGMFMGYTGVVTEKSGNAGDTTIKMRMAQVPEIFDNLLVDFDSSRQGTELMGVILPKGSLKKSGNDKNYFRKGANDEWEGNISIEFALKPKVKAVLNVGLKNMRVQKELDYYLSSLIPGNEAVRRPRYRKVESTVSGTATYKISIESGEAGGMDIEPVTIQNLWDSIAEETNITGLDDADKEGLVPLGGLVLSVGGVGAAIGPIPELTQKASVVVWVYLSKRGEIALDGKFVPLDAEVPFAFDLSLNEHSSGALVGNEKLDVENQQGLKAIAQAQGNLKAEQDLGLTMAADLFVGGIRPLGAQFTPVKAKGAIETEGKVLWDWLSLQFKESAVCFDDLRFMFGGDYWLRAALGVKILNWQIVDQYYELKNEFAYKEFKPFNLVGRCIAHGDLKFRSQKMESSSGGFTGGYTKYRFDLSNAFKNIKIPEERELQWALSVTTPPGLATGMPVPSSFTGKYNKKDNSVTPRTEFDFVLPQGFSYGVVLGASNVVGMDLNPKTFTETIKIPRALKVRAKSLDTACQRVQLEATGGDLFGEPVHQWNWNLTQGSFRAGVTTRQNTWIATLPGCGATQIALETKTAEGTLAHHQATVDIRSNAPFIAALLPMQAQIAKPTAFTITGENLPATAVMSIADAQCQAPTQRKPDGTGFTQTCTLQGAPGLKAVKIKTDTDANGGQVIEDALSVRALPAAAPSIFNLSPQQAVIDTATSFTITGQNLPATAVMSIADAQCQAPTQRKPDGTGFTQTCTLKGAPGLKAVMIKTDTDANGGQIIEDALSVRALPAAAPVTAGKVPHTGITAQQCYKKGSNTLVACNSVEAIALSGPGKQDGMRGHINTMSYSEVPGFARTECVKDNLTGLMWEGKTNDGGLRDGSKRYTNYADGRAGSALDYVNQVNAQGLCGHHDWRLPSVDELHSLVDFSKSHPGPTIDTAWFPNTPGATFWSGMLYAGYSANAWFVNFILGGAGYDSTRDRSIAVRLVRASQ